MAADLAIKEPCRVATTANIATLSTLLTVDGVTVAAGDRVLVRAQSTAIAERHLRRRRRARGPRATDFDGAGEVAGGTQVFVTRARASPTALAGLGQWRDHHRHSAITFDPEFLQAGSGAVPAHMQGKAREIVSVMDFGAVGDNATDIGRVQCLLRLDRQQGRHRPDTRRPISAFQPGHDRLDQHARQPRRSLATAPAFTSRCITALRCSAIRRPTVSRSCTSASIRPRQWQRQGRLRAGQHRSLRASRLLGRASRGRSRYAVFSLHNATASDPNTGCFWRLLDKCRSAYAPARRRPRRSRQPARGTAQTRPRSAAARCRTCSPWRRDPALQRSDDFPIAMLSTASPRDPDHRLLRQGRLRRRHFRPARVNCLFEDGTCLSRPAPPGPCRGDLPRRQLRHAGHPPLLATTRNRSSSRATPLLNPTYHDRAGPPQRQCDPLHRHLRLRARPDRPASAARGLRLDNYNGSLVANLTWTGTGVRACLGGGPCRRDWRSSAVQGIASTTMAASNLRGSVTLLSCSASVGFAAAEPDANISSTRSHAN